MHSFFLQSSAATSSCQHARTSASHCASAARRQARQARSWAAVRRLSRRRVFRPGRTISANWRCRCVVFLFVLFVCLFGWLVGLLVVCLFVCLFVCFLVCFLVCFVCLFVCLFVVCWGKKKRHLTRGGGAWQCLRFFDSETDYGERQLNMLLRALQPNPCEVRSIYFDAVRARRRRRRVAWQQTSLVLFRSISLIWLLEYNCCLIRRDCLSRLTSIICCVCVRRLRVCGRCCGGGAWALPTRFAPLTTTRTAF